jgi:hypothetical protein
MQFVVEWQTIARQVVVERTDYWLVRAKKYSIQTGRFK